MRVVWFQFHSGSIKTLREHEVVDHVRMFQFHSGSIKTPALQPPESSAFESMRLSALIFQSLSCSIKTHSKDGGTFHVSMFQFHSGSIKTDRMEARMSATVLVSIPLWFD